MWTPFFVSLAERTRNKTRRWKAAADAESLVFVSEKQRK